MTSEERDKIVGGLSCSHNSTGIEGEEEEEENDNDNNNDGGKIRREPPTNFHNPLTGQKLPISIVADSARHLPDQVPQLGQVVPAGR